MKTTVWFYPEIDEIDDVDAKQYHRASFSTRNSALNTSLRKPIRMQDFIQLCDSTINSLFKIDKSGGTIIRFQIPNCIAQFDCWILGAYWVWLGTIIYTKYPMYLNIGNTKNEENFYWWEGFPVAVKLMYHIRINTKSWLSSFNSGLSSIYLPPVYCWDQVISSSSFKKRVGDPPIHQYCAKTKSS